MSLNNPDYDLSLSVQLQYPLADELIDTISAKLTQLGAEIDALQQAEYASGNYDRPLVPTPAKVVVQEVADAIQDIEVPLQALTNKLPPQSQDIFWKIFEALPGAATLTEEEQAYVNSLHEAPALPGIELATD